MNPSKILTELESLGTAQNRKVYARHGVGTKLYGVSFANIDKLQKRIKVDHDLALSLWATGNHDARVLATRIADPAAATVSLLDEWKNDLDNYVVAGAFASFVEKTSLARKRMEQWTRSKQEWVGRSGWLLLAKLAMNDSGLPDDYFAPYLDKIENGIHAAKNRTRDAMNAALISIGLRSPGLRRKAVAAARRIGNVEVDHGQTNCKTPGAESYIHKAWQRKKQRK